MVSLDLLYAGMIVMGISAVMNFFVSQRLMKVAKETESIALESDAWHLHTDVLTSAGVFAGLVLIQITHLMFLDSVIAIIVALLILREADSQIRRSFADLMDEIRDEEEVILTREIICRHANGFTNFHSLKTRRSGPNRFVEFHLMMPYAMPLDAAHALTKQIETEICAEMPRTSVIVHLDPCDGRCERPECSFVCKEEE